MTEIEIYRDIVSLPGFFLIPKSKHDNPKRLERDFNLVRDKLKGMSYVELGKKYGISAGRCSQLIATMRRRYWYNFGKDLYTPES